MNSLRRFKMIVSYDGTAYAGYQIQPKHPTIQAELERAIEKVTGHKTRVYSSGRTDQGVHARGQVIHVDLPATLEVPRLFLGLNAALPRDIRVESVRKVKTAFDARFDATSKEYRYLVWNGPVLTPDLRHYREHVWQPMDVKAMRSAAKRLVGKHDFASFSANPRREVDGTVRTIHSLTVTKRGAEVTIVVKGDGFLYKMVRSLAGYLIRVGVGDLTPESAADILGAKERTARVPTAPSKGLFLWRVSYT